MPCNIGYKTYAAVEIPQPTPQEFRKKMPSPKVDQDLLDKLGVDDVEFLRWMNQLNIKPLLVEALKRALADETQTKVNFSVTDDGNILAESSYIDNSEKREIEKITKRVMNRWQMETFKIVTQLLGYDAKISSQVVDGKEITTMVAEEMGKTHPCKYICITKDSNGKGDITFEHFDSEEELNKEKVKFTALAQKLGIRLTLSDSPITGNPVPGHTHSHTKEQHRHKH